MHEGDGGMKRTKPKIEKSKSGVYHVLIEALPGVELFRDEDDMQFFGELVRKLNEEGDCYFYSFSLHKTYCHLLLKVGEKGLSVAKKALLCAYTYYYNVRYARMGSLFFTPSKAQAVETRNFFVKVYNAIMGNNPIMAVTVGITVPELSEDDSQDHVAVAKYVPRKVKVSLADAARFLEENFGFRPGDDFGLRPFGERSIMLREAKEYGISKRILVKLGVG